MIVTVCGLATVTVTPTVLSLSVSFNPGIFVCEDVPKRGINLGLFESAVPKLKSESSGSVFGADCFKTYPNADNPVGEDVDILAAFDVWEHSYYLDYKNDRKEHLTRVINELINYKFIESRLLEA